MGPCLNTARRQHPARRGEKPEPESQARKGYDLGNFTGGIIPRGIEAKPHRRSADDRQADVIAENVSRERSEHRAPQARGTTEMAQRKSVVADQQGVA